MLNALTPGQLELAGHRGLGPRRRLRLGGLAVRCPLQGARAGSGRRWRTDRRRLVRQPDRHGVRADQNPDLVIRRRRRNPRRDWGPSAATLPPRSMTARQPRPRWSRSWPRCERRKSVRKAKVRFGVDGGKQYTVDLGAEARHVPAPTAGRRDPTSDTNFTCRCRRGTSTGPTGSSGPRSVRKSLGSSPGSPWYRPASVVGQLGSTASSTPRSLGTRSMPSSGTRASRCAARDGPSPAGPSRDPADLPTGHPPAGNQAVLAIVAQGNPGPAGASAPNWCAKAATRPSEGISSTLGAHKHEHRLVGCS